MADVQLEHGFTRIAHELLRAIARAKLSELEKSALIVILDRTYGDRGSKVAPISAGTLATFLGVRRKQAQRILSTLVAKRVIQRHTSGRSRAAVGIVKDFDAWRCERCAANGDACEHMFRERPANDVRGWQPVESVDDSTGRAREPSDPGDSGTRGVTQGTPRVDPEPDPATRGDTLETPRVDPVDTLGDSTGPDDDSTRGDTLETPRVDDLFPDPSGTGTRGVSPGATVKKVRSRSTPSVSPPRSDNGPANGPAKNGRGLTVEPPDWVPREAWDGWVRERRRTRHPLTDHGAKIAITMLRQLRDAGQDLEAVLNQSAMAGYRGLFAVKGLSDGKGRPDRTSVAGATRAARRRARGSAFD